MELKELQATLEGILFAAGEPVPAERLCVGLDVDRETVDLVAQKLMDGLDRGYDFIVTNFANGDVIGHTSSDTAKPIAALSGSPVEEKTSGTTIAARIA